jgi:hypothetical protein
MSYWTHVLGVIKVAPLGRTQHEKTYILNTVLDHLPIVSGSEGAMKVLINVDQTYHSSSSCDEFMQRTNNLRDRYGDRSRTRGWLKVSDYYYLTIIGDLRDRMFNQTFQELQRWLCRLAKRVDVCEANISIYADDRREPYFIHEPSWDNPYAKMFENPSWVKESDGEPTWCEYLMWERDPYTGHPLDHVYKYVESEAVDKEMERRKDWREKRYL